MLTPRLPLWFVFLILSPCVRSDVGLSNGNDLMSFVTRPDLKPPKLRVKKHDPSKLAPGYLFIAPYNNHNHVDDAKWMSCQIGPTIYDQDGDLIWSGACDFNNRVAFDFKAIQFADESTQSLSLNIQHQPLDGAEVGAGVILYSNYEQRRTLVIEPQIGQLDQHEFNIIDGGRRALTVIRGAVPYSGGALGITEKLWIEGNAIQELNVKSGDRLFEWMALDHISLNESNFHGPLEPLEYERKSTWDIFHINSIDKNADGDYLVSIRHTNSICLVSRIDGHIIWRLGGSLSDFEMLDGLTFSRQHDARWIQHDNDTSIISIMDNAVADPEFDTTPPTNPFSRGIVVQLNHTAGENFTARAIRTYDRPDGGLSMLRGNMQTLPNNNVLMGWSQSGYLSEHTEDGECIMEAEFPSDRYSSYRQYKFEFEGAPTERPVVAATAYQTTGRLIVTICHVSWNGATQVASWNFYGNGSLLLGNAQRTGFETAFAYEGLATSIWAEALDVNGNPLGKSKEKLTIQPKQRVIKVSNNSTEGVVDDFEGQDSQGTEDAIDDDTESHNVNDEEPNVSEEVKESLITDRTKHPRRKLLYQMMFVLATMGILFAAIEAFHRFVGRRRLKSALYLHSGLSSNVKWQNRVWREDSEQTRLLSPR